MNSGHSWSRTLRARGGDITGARGRHLDSIGEPRVIAVNGAEIFEPVKRRLRHIACDADYARIQLVADQDAATRARICRPPANPERWVVRESGEDFVFERVPPRQVDADRRSRPRVRRLDIVRVWLLQAGK